MDVLTNLIVVIIYQIIMLYILNLQCCQFYRGKAGLGKTNTQDFSTT